MAQEVPCAVAYNNFLGLATKMEGARKLRRRKRNTTIELAAMSGDKTTRNNLGCMEGQTGNHRRTMTHLLISAKAATSIFGQCEDGSYKKKLYVIPKSYKQDEVKIDMRDKTRSVKDQSSDII